MLSRIAGLPYPVECSKDVIAREATQSRHLLTLSRIAGEGGPGPEGRVGEGLSGRAPSPASPRVKPAGSAPSPAVRERVLDHTSSGEYSSRMRRISLRLLSAPGAQATRLAAGAIAGAAMASARTGGTASPSSAASGPVRGARVCRVKAPEANTMPFSANTRYM